MNAVLVPVYAALGLEWRPEATGAVADEATGATRETVIDALLAEYARHYEVDPVGLDGETLALARKLAPEHLAP